MKVVSKRKMLYLYFLMENGWLLKYMRVVRNKSNYFHIDLRDIFKSHGDGVH